MSRQNPLTLQGVITILRGETSTRIRILWLLMEREWYVSELAGEMKMTESAISHQLCILRSARLVNGHKVGKNVFYSLVDEHVKEILENTYNPISER